MQEYKIAGKSVQFDESKTYMDFFIQDGRQRLVETNFGKMLELLQSGKMSVDNKFKDYLVLISRWTKEAPRKRLYRKMRSEGFNVVSSEQFFDGEGGDKVIDGLENTGKLADYLLKQLFPRT